MSRRVALSIGILFLAAVLSGGGRAQSAGEATIRVFVVPAHASVDVVSASVSHMTRSGATLELPAGTYDVVVQASGFETQRQVVVLTSEAAETLRVQLREADPSRRSHAGWRSISLGTLLFLLLFVSAYLYYLTKVQSRFYDVSTSLAGIVSDLRALMPASLGGARGVASANRGFRPMAEGATPDPPQKLAIMGPLDMRIGVQSEPFVARGTSARATWTLKPEDAGRVVHGPDANVVSVIAKKPGLLELTATAGNEAASLHAAALPHQDGGTWHLPWVGAGHGSILLAVIVTGALVVLGVLGILESGVIGTILGTMAGLILGRSASDRDREPRTGEHESGSGGSPQGSS